MYRGLSENNWCNFKINTCDKTLKMQKYFLCLKSCLSNGVLNQIHADDPKPIDPSLPMSSVIQKRGAAILGRTGESKINSYLTCKDICVFAILAVGHVIRNGLPSTKPFSPINQAIPEQIYRTLIRPVTLHELCPVCCCYL